MGRKSRAAKKNAIRAVVFQKGDWLCARCLEHDFVVQAKTLQQLSRALQLFIVGHIAVRLRNLATDGSGGGVFASAAVAIINSTLTGNRTNFGGGGLAGGSGIIVNTTIANNDGGFSVTPCLPAAHWRSTTRSLLARLFNSARRPPWPGLLVGQ